MLRIHQPYIKKRKVKYLFVLASMGAFLLGSCVVINSSSESSVVYAAGESRTIHDIENMQDMTQQICSNTSPGDTAILKDTRDDNSYRIVKMLDDTCWMGENLRIIDKTIDSTDSNMESGSFTIPASSTTDFGYAMTNIDGYTPHAYYSNNAVYGTFYNWYTATAGAGNADVINGIVNSSICPKNWRLPNYDGAKSFYSITDDTNGYKSDLVTGQTIDGVSNISGYYFGYNSTALNGKPNFWPEVGYVYKGGYQYVLAGHYWANKAGSDAQAAYMRFESHGIYPKDYGYRYYGNSIRCVAEDLPIWEESLDGNVNVNVPSILTIDATSGMDEIADSSKVIEGTATATISSNTEYTVTLHSSQPSLKDIDNSTNTSEISPVSESNPVQPGNNSWGLWNGTSGPKTYTLPITTTPTEFPNTSTSSITEQGNTTTHIYYVGISISPALPSGTYGTDVVVTASVK